MTTRQEAFGLPGCGGVAVASASLATRPGLFDGETAVDTNGYAWVFTLETPTTPSSTLVATTNGNWRRKSQDTNTNTTQSTVVIEDISAGVDTVYVAAPATGTITAIYACIKAGVTDADATLTTAINGTPITDGAVTVAYDGSAAGDVFTATPSAARAVTAGQTLSVATDGGSTGVCPCCITFVITVA